MLQNKTLTIASNDHLILHGLRSTLHLKVAETVNSVQYFFSNFKWFQPTLVVIS